jgi:HSP20 family protein
MSLIPWRNKSHEGSSGGLAPQGAMRMDVGRLMDRFFTDPFGLANDFSPWAAGELSTWMPSLDISESEKEVTVRAEVPGVEPKDLDVTVTGDRLVLTGEKKESSESHEHDFSHRETRYGSFRREVRLPPGIDAEHVTADYSNGVVTIRLQRVPSAMPRRVNINGGDTSKGEPAKNE